ncbi:MAG: hypothetical protein GX162_00860 [Firmicutes bacterium]|nr:hypothetical protein [Bacillota bacterium]
MMIGDGALVKTPVLGVGISPGAPKTAMFAWLFLARTHYYVAAASSLMSMSGLDS